MLAGLFLMHGTPGAVLGCHDPAGAVAAHVTGTADGYTVTVDGVPKAGAAGELRAAVLKDGSPVTDLQPYLESYAHPPRPGRDMRPGHAAGA